MINSEKPHSEYFEELCALAASGLISEAEFVELRDHMQSCAECRSAQADFIDLLHYKLPLAAPEPVVPSRLTEFLSGRSLYRSRFLSRARKQGLAISQGSWPGSRDSNPGFWLLGGSGDVPVFAMAMVVLLAAIAVLSYNLRQSTSRDRELAAMSKQSDRRERPLPNPTQESGRGSLLAHGTDSPFSSSTPSVSTSFQASQELLKVRQDLMAAEARLNAVQEQSQTAAVELQATKIQLSDSIAARNQSESRLEESEQNITQVNRELQSVREGRSKDATAIVAQGLQIRQLSERLSAQTESLERERSLLAAGRDIQDLMGARNLHIVDVLDVDSKGKDSRTFGRVFYTEGKSLIFYAFDLGDRSVTKRNASFQVWGARGPAQSPAKSLGIFYVDDQKQNRWVLRFEDPDILAEIDSVFVTVEPAGGSMKPTGHKFLYAYLKASPNHP